MIKNVGVHQHLDTRDCRRGQRRKRQETGGDLDAKASAEEWTLLHIQFDKQGLGVARSQEGKVLVENFAPLRGRARKVQHDARVLLDHVEKFCGQHTQLSNYHHTHTTTILTPHTTVNNTPHNCSRRASPTSVTAANILRTVLYR